MAFLHVCSNTELEPGVKKLPILDLLTAQCFEATTTDDWDSILWHPLRMFSICRILLAGPSSFHIERDTIRDTCFSMSQSGWQESGNLAGKIHTRDLTFLRARTICRVRYDKLKASLVLCYKMFSYRLLITYCVKAKTLLFLYQCFACYVVLWTNKWRLVGWQK